MTEPRQAKNHAEQAHGLLEQVGLALDGRMGDDDHNTVALLGVGHALLAIAEALTPMSRSEVALGWQALGEQGGADKDQEIHDQFRAVGQYAARRGEQGGPARGQR